MSNDHWNKVQQQGEADRRNNLPPNPNIPDGNRNAYNSGYNKKS